MNTDIDSSDVERLKYCYRVVRGYIDENKDSLDYYSVSALISVCGTIKRVLDVTEIED